MIAKWGRRGSRTSITSLPSLLPDGDPRQADTHAKPSYGRSISQISLPPIHLPSVTAEARTSKNSTFEESFGIIGSPTDYVSLDSPKSPHQASTFPRKSKSPSVCEDSLSDDVFQVDGSLESPSQGRERPRSLQLSGRSESAPLLGVPKTGPPRNSNSPTSQKDLLGSVPEDYSLDRFDNVFASHQPLEPLSDGQVMSESASKYILSSQLGALPDVVNGYLGNGRSPERTPVGETSPGLTESNSPRPPLTTTRKKRAGLLEKPEDVLKYLTPTNTFAVHLQKTSRGLGLGIFGGSDLDRLGPVCQLVRVRKLYPLQAALESGQIAVGDVILQVNGHSTLGLKHTEALELLRVAPSDVHLKIYRPNPAVMPPVSFYIKDVSPNSSFIISPPGSTSNTLSRPKSVNSQEYEAMLLKKEGSLGFSIVRHQQSNEDDIQPTGIYVKALVREPALSHGRLAPGDRIISVNGTDISAMSHPEAVSYLRNASDTVVLRLVSNSDPLWTLNMEEDSTKPVKHLRKEAMDMLSNRAKLKDNKTSPRRLKHKRTDSDSASSSDSANETSQSSPKQLLTVPDQSLVNPALIKDVSENIPETRPEAVSNLVRSLRPKSLDGLSFNEKKPSSAGTENKEHELPFHRQGSVLEPAGKDLGTEGAGLLKWRGATLHNNSEGESASPSSGSIDLSSLQVSKSNFEITPTVSPVPQPPPRINSLPYEDEALVKRNGHISAEENRTPQVVKVHIELDRGWHGRLGFSLSDILPNEKPNPLSNYTSPVVRAVHPGSIAYKDGRIKLGDRLVRVNGESMVDRPATEVIDLLRKTRGKMRMDLLRVQQEFDNTSHSSSGS